MSPDHPCSERCYQLEAMPGRELDQLFVRGQHPDMDTLAGWEFRGTNHPGWAKVVGIKKFIKGFFLRDGELYGYNSPAVQNGIKAPWIGKPDDLAAKRFGFYKVTEVDPESRDNAYLHSVLLDYGRGGNKPWDPTSHIRDYLVRVDPDNDDLFLGKALIALGPARVATNFFILERHRQGPDDAR
jgi:hypothetical protein